MVGDFTEDQTREVMTTLTQALSQVVTPTEWEELMMLLNAFQPWQVSLITDDLLNAIPPDRFSSFEANILNALKPQQIRERSPEQIANIKVTEFPKLSEGCIVSLGEKYKFLNAKGFRDEKALANLWAKATGEQLRLSSKGQMENVDLNKTPNDVLANAFQKGGIQFTKLFSSDQIDRLEPEKLQTIPDSGYLTLIFEICRGMSEREIQQYTNMPQARYYEWLSASVKRLLTDEVRREILKGTYRASVSIASRPGTQAVVSERSLDGTYQIFPQMPAPPTVGRQMPVGARGSDL